MKIAVLAVQGDFQEHGQRLASLGVDWCELRQRPDLEQNFDGLILPGGESTVQSKLLRELGMFASLREKILSGLPTLGTCAGLILLAERLSNDSSVHFGTLPATVRRNAYGRQLGSFFTEADMTGIGRIPMKFIRAPYIESVRGGTEILARTEGQITAVRYQNQLGLSFHPELCPDNRLFQYFLQMVRRHNKKNNSGVI